MVDDVTILNYSAASRTFVFRLSPSVVVRCTQSGLGPVPAAVAAAVLFRRLTGSLPACRPAWLPDILLGYRSPFRRFRPSVRPSAFIGRGRALAAAAALQSASVNTCA